MYIPTWQEALTLTGLIILILFGGTGLAIFIIEYFERKNEK